jgi:hypothetical protein
MQVRYLQTLTEIGAERNVSIMFLMPVDIVKPFLELLDSAGKVPAANGVIHGSPMNQVPLRT